jgi:hypothetical protein
MFRNSPAVICSTGTLLSVSVPGPGYVAIDGFPDAGTCYWFSRIQIPNATKVAKSSTLVEVLFQTIEH